MRILVADDAVAERALLCQFLVNKGHIVEEVGDGQEAVTAVTRQRFDLVLLDSIMPVMVGNEAVRHIRKRDAHMGRYTPVLFVSGLNDPTEVVASLAFGADDYLSKPIDLDILEAKLRVFDRIASQHRALEQYRQASEGDKAFARHVLDHLTRANRAFSEEVRHFVRPHDQLSGDLFAAARAPDGTICALLADAMGHGLAASLTTVLLAQVFYTMAERNQPLSTIVSESNTKLKALLPPGFFVAAAFVRVEPLARCVQVWNGGIPLVRLIGSDRVLKDFPSAFMALGVLAPREFDSTIEEYHTQEPAELLLATDGVTEALGDQVAEDAWLSFDGITRQIGSGSAHDDATLASLKVS